ncbi:GyrI-like domain-containing protein [Flavobacterium sp. RHBU_3]|uniref:GyrI-like domain-containing protein n=1 Tax=Flavobacterium sp. RHBU_3 TaxID=3391184 RepID=UPI003985408E
MKIAKYVFLLLLLAAIALTVFIATQNGTYTIEKHTVVNVPRPVLYNYVNDFKNWENLGMLKGADSTATFKYSGRTSGAGAFMKWESAKGSGNITTIANAENDSISQKTEVDNLESSLAWKFKDTLKSTRVSIKLTGKLTFMEKAEALIKGGISKNYEKNIQQGLENLNAYLVTELRNYKIDIKDIVTKKGAFYLGHTIKSPLDKVNGLSVEQFEKLEAFAKQNNMAINGVPFIIYKNLDKTAKTADCTFAIPLKEAIFTSAGSEYNGGEIIPFKALKTSLKGDYSHLPAAWKKAWQHVAEKTLEENTTGEYLEIYTKNIKQTRRPSQWQTDIYIPIGKPIIVDSLSTQPVLPPINDATVAPATNQPVKPAIKPQTGTKPVTTPGTKPQQTAPNTVPATGTSTPATGTKPSGTTASSLTRTQGGTGVKPTGTTTGNRTGTGTTTGGRTTTSNSTPSGRTAGSRTSTNQATGGGRTTGTSGTTTGTAPRTRTTTAPATTTPRSTSTTTSNKGDDGLNPPRG